MTYSATAYRLLLSAPGDVSDEDIATVMATIARWNAVYGPQFGAVVVPTHWKLHSAAEHGIRPQESLNVQLVEKADIVIAIFWQRLGSPTGEAASGTLEEIEEATAAGAYVAILRCARDLPRRGVDPDQLKKLDEFYEQVATRSLMLDFADSAELTRHVDAILNASVTRTRARAETVVEGVGSGAAVWPRIESGETAETDARGRIRTRRSWRLVLANTGQEPARRVRYRLEQENPEDHLPIELDARRELEVLAPGGEASYTLLMTAAATAQMRCVVEWEDSAGEHANAATLRAY
jgi:hypothetical protein